MSSAAVKLPDDVAIHRIGGGFASNLILKPSEAALDPPGISTLSGGIPAEAAAAMRRHFPRMTPKGRTTVGTTTAGRIRQAGFDVIMNPTPRFPQHARLTHPAGVAGFTQQNLEELAKCFQNQSGL